MRSALFSLAIAVMLSVAAYYGYNAVQTQRGQQALDDTRLNFRSLPDALVTAKAANLPVLVDFSAIWCPTCRHLHKTVFTDTAVKAAIAKDYVLARVDYEAPEAAAFMKAYDVSGFPSLLILSSDGKLLRRVPVSFEPATFVAELALPND